MFRLLLLAFPVTLFAASLQCSPQPLRPPARATLRLLAARARYPKGWKALRRYARNAPDEELRGMAYFTLGYREYLAKYDGMAAQDLKASASTGCLIADFAEYYEALADRQANRPEDAIDALTGFTTRHPTSVLRQEVVSLLAQLLLKAGHPNRALVALEAEPFTQTDASLLLLWAQADEALHHDTAAVKAFQKVYVFFPNMPEDRQAEAAMAEIQRRIGSHVPELSEGDETERVRNLYRIGLYQQALSSDDRLLLGAPHSPLAGEWRVRRARCLLRMRQYSEAVEALSQKIGGNSDLDAERLAIIVHAYELEGDESSMLEALQGMYHEYPQSAHYGDALAFAGGFFARQGFWRTAAPYYAELARGFPGGTYATEAAWRVAWYDVLAGNLLAARAGMVDFLRRYPSSSRAPAALYWLATIDSRLGNLGSARDIFSLLARQYASTYYGLKGRLKILRPPDRGAVTAFARPVPALTRLEITIPPRPLSSLTPCATAAPDENLRPYEVLHSMSLNELGVQYLGRAIAMYPSDPRLSLAMAESQASRHDASGAIFAAKRATPDYEDYSFPELPAELWHILYPRAYWSFVRRTSHAEGLNPYLIMGLIRQESSFNSRATSSTHARGLMQMEPYTAADHVRSRWRRRRLIRSLYNPATNIRAGCLYLRGILRSFGGNLPETLAAYNAGDYRVRQWITNSKVQDPDEFIETIPFTDTRAYVEMVLRDSMIYHAILTGQATFRRCAQIQ